jgi:hypothetical protein
VGAINNNFSKSDDIRDRLLQLNAILGEYNCTIVADYIPGHSNIVADRISWQYVGEYFTVNPAVIT